MEVRNLYIGEGLNQLFNITENVDIISASYDVYSDTGRFFINKRNGIQKLLDGTEEIVDFGTYSDSVKQENLVLQDDRLSKFTLWTITDIATGLWENGVLNKVTAPWGTYLTTWTATGGSATTLEDSAGGWTINEFAGFYIWIADWKNAGQIKFILSNTATEITVAGWTGGASIDTTSVYYIYNQLATTVLISDRENKTVHFYDGTTIREVKTLNYFDKWIFYNNRLWTVSTSNPNIIWYSYEWEYLVNEWFIDSGIGLVKDMFVLWDFLLLFKEASINCISKFTDWTGEIIFNSSEIVSNVGIYNKWAVGMYLANCYFLWSDKQIQNIQVGSDGVNLTGNLTVVGRTMKNYLQTLPDEPAYTSFVLWDNFFEIIAGNKWFKYWDFLQSWTFNEYGINIRRTKRLNRKYFYSTGESIGALSRELREDFGLPYTERVWFMIGIENVFSIKTIQSIKFLFWYNTKEKISAGLKLFSYTSAKRWQLSWDLDQTDTWVPLAEYKLLGESFLGETLLWGGVVELDTSLLFILKKILNRSGYFFQLLLESNTDYWFDIGEVQIMYELHTSLIHPSKTTL